MDHWDKTTIEKRIREKRRPGSDAGSEKKRDRGLDMLLALFIFLASLLAVIFVIAITG